MTISSITDAIWTAPTRTLAAGTLAAPTTRAEEIADAIWAYANRGLTPEYRYHGLPARKRVRRPDQFTLDREHPLARGLVFAGLGGLSQGTSKFTDSSPYGNHGTLTGFDYTATSGWKYVPELGRMGLVLDGNDDLVSGTGVYDLYGVSGLTASTWVDFKTIGGAAADHILTKSTATTLDWLFFAYDNASNNLAAQVGIGLYRVTADESAKTGLHHYHFTYDGGKKYTGIRIYVDGVECSYASGFETTARNAWDAANLLRIGNRADGLRPLDGSVYDPTIHSRILSPAEIQILANRSDPLLGGLIRPPRRTVFPAAVAPPGPFGINPSTGEILIVSPGSLAAGQTWQVVVRATDATSATDEGTITINLTEFTRMRWAMQIY
jgi:hypothetical protein